MFQPSFNPGQIVEEKILSGNSGQSPEARYNVLPFEHPADSLEVHFSIKNFADAHRFNIKTLPEEYQPQFAGKDSEYIYTAFEPFEGSVVLTIELRKHLSIARAYYTKLIRDYLSGSADVVEPNFLHDTMFWFVDSGQPNPEYLIYKKYIIRVEFDHLTRQPEILISFAGISRVSNSNLNYLKGREGFDSNLLKSVLFRKRCYQYTKAPETARYHPEEVFPVLNRELALFCKIKTSSAPDKIKHKRYADEFSNFFNTWINTPRFKGILPHKGIFKAVAASDLLNIHRNTNLLLFGEGKCGPDPREGIKRFGPAKLPEYKRIQYFFIYSDKDTEPVRNIYSYIRQDSQSDGGLNLFMKLPYELNKSLNITFDPKDAPTSTILEKISKLELEPDIAYYAFYISPWTIFETDMKKWVIHPRIKEALLRRGIMMQTLDGGKLLNSKLRYFMPNLAIAMTAKLGGIPWRLNNDTTDELIIGFGAFRSNKHNIRYVGASFCFRNDGTFQKFDCFRADELHALAGSVEEALYSYMNIHKQVKRIIIHFYKQLSRKELKPIELMLRSLKIDIPVIVVSINKTSSDDRIVLIEGDNGSMPVAGSIFRYGFNKYLFYINDKLGCDQNSLSCMPMPLKISFSSNKREILHNPEVITELMQQVFDFCFMYWRSMKHSAVPVTVAYPEMLARIYPWFANEVLDDLGTSRLFFL